MRESLKDLECKRAELIQEIAHEKGALKVLLMSALEELEGQIELRRGTVQKFHLRRSIGVAH
jgi:hypothetical protein